jgi:uncharacterized membrane protein YgcG
MINKYKSISITFFLLFLTLSLFQNLAAQEEFPPRPEPPMLINDLAGVLSPGQRDALENKLDHFNEKTSTQIAVVTITIFTDTTKVITHSVWPKIGALDRKEKTMGY